MTRICFCCTETWEVPEQAGEWWAHIKTPEYEERIRTPEARARIDAHWKARELESAGMLF